MTKADHGFSRMQFSMLFFSSDARQDKENKYDLLLSCAEYGDKNGFEAVWIPERHFHQFGGLYPNPSVLGGAIAVKTSRIRIRAGSVILPLHDPIRVVEEWSAVDNLSGGRVDLAFGQGWNPNDFVLAPGLYVDRLTEMYKDMEIVTSLWQGKKTSRLNGMGKICDVEIYPKPIQENLNIWITCSGSMERFIEAGAYGANILTALLFQDRHELAMKISAYRNARLQHGHDPQAGRVTVMLHTYIGEDIQVVRREVRPPMLKYLEESVDLWRQKSDQLENLAPNAKEKVLEFAFERYFRSHSLCGTPESCSPMVTELGDIGVNEIACLLDFGVPIDSVMASLGSLNNLKNISNNVMSPA